MAGVVGLAGSAERQGGRPATEGGRSHLGPARPFLGVLPFTSAAFGRLYDRSRRLLPLIAAHWGIDAVVTVAALLGVPV